MITALTYLLVLATLLALVPVLVLFIEVIAAIALRYTEPFIRQEQLQEKRLAVLVPAHDESSGLTPTISDIMAQLRECDELIVIADNCSDDTAAVAALGGARVVQRNDRSRTGKGYALDWGLRHLSAQPPDVVIVIDADCRLSPGFIEQIANCCIATGRPVQALDLMTAPSGSPINYQVAEFAWRVKNWVRPLGLKNLHLPCQLMGTGMAFPWEIIAKAKLASGQIVEDLRLGLDLARDRNPALFYPAVSVTSEFPTSQEGGRRQRERWEHGHIQTITSFPSYLTSAMGQRNRDLFVLALDMAVPPIGLLGFVVSGLLATSSLAVLLGAPSAPFIISTAGFAIFLSAVCIAWFAYGRDIVPPRQLVSIGSYMLQKAKFYARLPVKGFSRQWIRTDRTRRKQ